jgi:pimeloyl-ACP methyl ester carboxylesterase
MKGQTWLTGDDQYHRVAKHCVLMIEGERDAFVPLEDSMEMIRLLRYAYLVVFDKGSHMLVLEKADVISRLLYLFINDSFK